MRYPVADFAVHAAGAADCANPVLAAVVDFVLGLGPAVAAPCGVHRQRVAFVVRAAWRDFYYPPVLLPRGHIFHCFTSVMGFQSSASRLRSLVGSRCSK